MWEDHTSEWACCGCVSLVMSPKVVGDVITDTILTKDWQRAIKTIVTSYPILVMVFTRPLPGY